MGYRVPTFNLTCNISAPPFANNPAIPAMPYRLSGVACQLTHGRRVNVRLLSSPLNFKYMGQGMSLLVAKGTDIRGPQDTTSLDMVEVPAGSGRWYFVDGVDDVGKGFTNEYREASITALFGTWAPPYA